MERVKKILLIWVLLLVVAATVDPPKVKVYLIMSYRGNDLSIEKVYLKKENAEKYRDMYKESHNYTVEERDLTE
jgi:ribulose 1,5-bisphosphate synthetase/thiazole synthase